MKGIIACQTGIAGTLNSLTFSAARANNPTFQEGIQFATDSVALACRLLVTDQGQIPGLLPAGEEIVDAKFKVLRK